MNQLTETTVAPALAALVETLFDYAGIYPPAAISLDNAMDNYKHYRDGHYAWMLRWLVVGNDDLKNVPSWMDGALSILSSADQPRAATVEAKTIVPPAGRPVYVEVAPGNLDYLEAVKKSGCFAKIRTGGVTPEAIPTAAQVAGFINVCAELKLPMKATAGLHHPIRGTYALTYAPDAPKGVMHGFLNVVMAAVFAWSGERDIEPILLETDPKAFSFDTKAHFRDQAISAEKIRDARIHFFHSIGSCSFDEPVNELKALGLLPEHEFSA